MGRRGPAKTPTNILKSRGSWRGENRKGEPLPEQGPPRCPIWLTGEAKRVWRYCTKQLQNMRVLTKADRGPLARYCQMFSQWKKSMEFIREKGEAHPVYNDQGQVVGMKLFPQAKLCLELNDRLLRIEQQFGLTPSARASLGAAPEEKKKQADGPEKYVKIGP